MADVVECIVYACLAAPRAAWIGLVVADEVIYWRSRR